MQATLRSIAVGMTLIGGLAGANSQEIFVRDLKCRADAILACVAVRKATACDRGAPITLGGGLVCPGPYKDTPEEDHANWCATKVDNLEAGTCLTPVNLQALINSSGILAELKETNRAIRDDQRALLNELCRAVGGQPDKCDESLPVRK